MKAYKVISDWPGSEFKAGEIITLYPSGNLTENRYGCRVENDWVWVHDPGNYPLVFGEIKS